MSVEIKPNQCSCHPETCGCHKHYVFVDGQQTNLGGNCPKRLGDTVKKIAEAYYRDKEKNS